MTNQTKNYLLQDLEIFTELDLEEADNVNGGFFTYPNTVSGWAGATLGNLGSGWWNQNFWTAANSGDIDGAIAVTDQYLNSLVNNLQSWGISVPNYPF